MTTAGLGNHEPVLDHHRVDEDKAVANREATAPGGTPPYAGVDAICPI